MRFALFTSCLIFMENFFLFYGHSLDRIVEVDHSDFKNPVDAANDQDEILTLKSTFPDSLDNFIRDPFGDLVERRILEESPMRNIDSEEPSLRHERHGKRYKKHSLNIIGTESLVLPSKDTSTSDKKNSGYVNDRRVSNDGSSLSPVSQHKLKTLGTRDAANEEFQKKYHTLPASIRIMEEEKQKAIEHYQKMKNQTVCRSPSPKIIKVSDIYPEIFKVYYPSCTVLHQCSKDSGCCPEKMKCAPFKTENVTLYFKVATRSRGGTSYTYEGLSFYNHTDCQCIEEQGRMTRDTANFTPTRASPQNDRSNVSYPSRCRCPAPFSVRMMANGSCACDCYDRQSDCIKFKKGLEYFSLKDKYCLFINQCTYPTCNYGSYLNTFGRCPKINETHLF